jgi:hypothetical protein
MDSVIVFSCVVGICGEGSRNSAGSREPGKTVAIDEAGEAPGAAVAVETYVVIRGIETLELALREIGAGSG